MSAACKNRSENQMFKNIFNNQNEEKEKKKKLNVDKQIKFLKRKNLLISGYCRKKFNKEIPSDIKNKLGMLFCANNLVINRSIFQDYYLKFNHHGILSSYDCDEIEFYNTFDGSFVKSIDINTRKKISFLDFSSNLENIIIRYENEDIEKWDKSNKLICKIKTNSEKIVISPNKKILAFYEDGLIVLRPEYKWVKIK